jgi:hypothetical protein
LVKFLDLVILTILIVTGDYRLNIPVRNTTASTISDMMYNHNPGAGTTNGDSNNGFELYFPSYIFKPGSQYMGYPSKLQNYYSQIGRI